MKGNKANCHPELDSGSRRCFIKGFTLIELLIVVLIIGVLAAVALPQYQKAVLKSRFSSLMPTTKAIRDGNEMYYMTNGRYSDALAKLDVTTTNTDDMTITLSNDDEYAYTMATRPNINNNLIMYQKHSANFPGEIHCEALKDNSQAQWLCGTALHAVKELGEVITEGYNTYVLEGTGSGIAPGADDGTMSCTKAEELGFTCTVDEAKMEKKICKSGFCQTKTFDENGGYTVVVCQVNEEGICKDHMSSSKYNASGYRIWTGRCKTVASDGTCSEYDWGTESTTFDAQGRPTNVFWCSKMENDGTCSEYENVEYYAYDANGNKIKSYSCWTSSDGTCIEYSDENYEYTYDANGNLTKSRDCAIVASDGTCSEYGSGTDYTYDEDGKEIRAQSCFDLESDGTCSIYDRGHEYTYDNHGNMTRERDCYSYESDGTCNEYYDYGTEYIYDSYGNKKVALTCGEYNSDGTCSMYEDYYDIYDINGNLTRERYCNSIESDGTCSEYNSDGGYDYTYDAYGRVTSEIECDSVESDGSCVPTFAEYYTYDANGNEIEKQACNLGSDGKCRNYASYNESIYDEEGNQIVKQYCDTSRLDTKTGECINPVFVLDW